MDPHPLRSRLRVIVLGLGAFGISTASAHQAHAGPRHPDPAQVVPLDKIAPQHRESVAEVIRENHFHRQGKAETFPCNPRIYLALLNEPELTLALWHDLGNTPAQLKQIGPDRFQGTDGAGTTATWEFVLRSPRLHVLLCDLDYVSPRGNARLQGRIVMVVRSGYYREVNGEHWVRQELEAFVKVDSKGWKAVAVTLRPLIEKLLEDQVQEAGWFVSLMGRLVEAYPNWASQTTAQQTSLRPEARTGFRDLIAQTRRPGALTGRPALADATPEATTRTR